VRKLDRLMYIPPSKAQTYVGTYEYDYMAGMQLVGEIQVNVQTQILVILKVN